MKNPKIGERVRIYAAQTIEDGVISGVSGNLVTIDFKRFGASTQCTNDRRQCVRLVKKKHREWWINVNHLDSTEGPYICSQKPVPCLSDHYIHVREVEKK